MAYCRPFQINTNVVSAEKNYWFFQKYLKHKDVCSKPVVSQSIWMLFLEKTKLTDRASPPPPRRQRSAGESWQIVSMQFYSLLLLFRKADTLCPCSFVVCYCYCCWRKLTYYAHHLWFILSSHNTDCSQFHQLIWNQAWSWLVKLSQISQLTSQKEVGKSD